MVLSTQLVACAQDVPPADTAPPAITEALRPYDVSILVPLPEASKRTSMLGPDAGGPRGELLPRGLYAQLPTLEKFGDNVLMYDLLRVVGIRLDPCFPTLDRASPDGCKPQVRVVMQPIRLEAVDDQLTLVAVDVAVHLFYSVETPALEELLAWTMDARKQAVPDAASAPLGVHPALARDGVEGPFAQALGARLLGAVGEDNLTRVTVMTLGDFGNVWIFAGFDVSGDTLVPFGIPTISANAQKVSNTDSSGMTFAAGKFQPPVSGPEDVSVWLDSSAASAATPTVQEQAFAALLRLENPGRHDPTTVDCATCHVAPAARQWATENLGLAASDFDEEYRDPSGRPVAGATTSRTDELRMFGYFDTRPSISQRTVNETDALVRFWNAELELD